MRSYVWCEIVCACCSANVAGRFTTQHIPRREMSADAKRLGWVQSKHSSVKDWYCPQCKSEIDK